MGKQWKKEGKLENSSKKGRLFTRISREIKVASKMGANPDNNSRLRSALQWARSQSMPSKTIKRVLEKDDSEILEEIMYEGFGQNGIAFLVFCITNNKVRTVAEVRSVFKKYGGNMVGSVLWMFDKCGCIEAQRKKPCDWIQETIEVEALDFEAEPNSNEEGYFFCELSKLPEVARRLEQRDFAILSSKIFYKPKQRASLTEEQKGDILLLHEALENLEDCQEIFSNKPI